MAAGRRDSKWLRHADSIVRQAAPSMRSGTWVCTASTHRSPRSGAASSTSEPRRPVVWTLVGSRESRIRRSAGNLHSPTTTPISPRRVGSNGADHGAHKPATYRPGGLAFHNPRLSRFWPATSCRNQPTSPNTLWSDPKAMRRPNASSHCYRGFSMRRCRHRPP